MIKFVLPKRSRFLLLFLIVTLPFLFGIAYMIGFNGKAHAAITLDTKSQSSGAGAAGISWQHTVNDNPDRILIVGVTTLSIDSASPASVTFNGIALTRYVSGNCAAGLLCNASLWYLVNPPIGTYTINVTNGGSISGANGGAVSYYNINTAQPFNKSVVSSGTTNNSTLTTSVTVPSVASSDVVVDAMAAGWNCGTTATVTPGTGQTQNWKVYDNLQNCIISAGSFKTGITGNTTMTWSIKKNDSNTISWGAAAAVLSQPITTPTPTPTPTIAPTPTSVPSQGNITNLNFGISNASPWMQVACGDLRMDSGFTNPLPSGQSTITTNTSCADPGIVYTGETTASFGNGQASSSNQIVGGSTYPELYSAPGNGGIFSSYNSLLAKAKNSQTPPTDLATICTLNNCTLPATLPHGVYIAHSGVTLNAYTFPSNQNYVFLIDGDLTINGNIITPTGTNSSVIFSASGNIIVPPTIGSNAAITTANLSGIFSTDKSFIMQSNNTCTDLRLNIEGSLVVNAGLSGGSLQNKRDLCSNNATAPTLQITQRLDYVLNMPDFVKDQAITSQEIAP